MSAPQTLHATFRALYRPSETARTMMPSLEFSVLYTTGWASVTAWSMSIFDQYLPSPH